ncbi:MULTISPECIES: SMP-30/gluconolactonase/LRE family protein [unclassified Microbacterium]|uniref:SMP-30/gluconolactonase/LRE family protein n=1 Tax=unclassified Microbacterium TaxID=2609290 RepID=UPI000EA89985|nr:MULTISPECIES: SMP-30/gluconolactonase/LRE family protein [unclassified Microbacterium]MBT2484216.1 SMP-30/gluconolactonase/LRE family protein [Microbacterium sp. ISL-108]RKN67148.1 SMP-30/gluconolactonase/LRE family protein [Microbacterium sp. CGR2]
MTPENVTGPIAHHAEAPVWWGGWGGLRFVDGDAGDLLTLRSDGVTRQHFDDEYLAFARPRRNGGLVAVGARTLYLADDVDGEAREAARLLDDPAVRMNDGCCDARGRLLAGSMSYESTPDAGVLLRLDADLAVSTLVPRTTVSNGIGFSPDGRRAYFNDTATQRVDVFDVVDGELRGRRAFVKVPEEQGAPDGLTVAEDGSVWVALWGGSAVHGYDASGALIATIELPVPQVSACTFGDDDLGTLYITTSAQGLPVDHDTAAGSVFAVRPGVRGLPVAPYAG